MIYLYILYAYKQMHAYTASTTQMMIQYIQYMVYITRDDSDGLA